MNCRQLHSSPIVRRPRAVTLTVNTTASLSRHLVHLLKPTLQQSPTFPDVLLADILTSFAKVLGDVWLTACFLVPRRNHHEWWNGRGSLVVPFLAT